MKEGLRAIPLKHIATLLFITLFVLYTGVSCVSGCGSKKMKIPDITRVDKSVPLVMFLGNCPLGVPVKGVAYYHKGPQMLKILQSVPGGVLAISNSDRFFEGIFMIITDREYVDDALLSSGLYVYSGLYTYQTSLGGAKKVHCFAEVPDSVADKLWSDKARKQERLKTFHEYQKLVNEPSAQTK